jgi:hypothetical protein
MENFSKVLLISFWCLSIPLKALSSETYFTENFEQGSIFGPAPGYSRSTLTGETTAPNTIPALHINQGGDSEFLYTEANFTHVDAFAPGVYGDARIDGYVGIGSAGSSGGILGGLILRATGPLDYYVAYIDSEPDLPTRGADFFWRIWREES